MVDVTKEDKDIADQVLGEVVLGNADRAFAVIAAHRAAAEQRGAERQADTIASLHAELEEARGLLENAQEILDDACHVSRLDPVTSPAVSALGDSIGYGALMSQASAIWRARLGEQAGGEFCNAPCRKTAENLRTRLDAFLAKQEPTT